MSQNTITNPSDIVRPTDDAKGSVTKCGCEIKSKTIFTRPTPLTRTIIGVGEEVELTTSAPATWTGDENDKFRFIEEVMGGGLPGVSSSSNGTKKYTTQINKPTTRVIFKALDEKGKITITAKTKCGECKKEFTIVEPSSISLEKINAPDLSTIHQKGHPSCGFFANVVVTPKNVSFQNVIISEADASFSAEGVFADNEGKNHQKRQQWFPLFFYNENKGSYSYDEINNVGVADTIYTGKGEFTNDLSGKISTDIKVYWSINFEGAGGHELEKVMKQEGESDAMGTCIITKDGLTSGYMNLNDESSSEKTFKNLVEEK